ncbi:MAG TPA: heme-binding protein [Povalibacter sp.]|uniref:GlcG/HbpS family heme-binding protein n=1 Tax=Povalibacter sp. TaxID=1962978 RepID=UPI002CC93D01|nr:heme-binding protein [Povalibacter sp.]HMN43795.1 heme-binding protein [Povalibacter sp.]
MIRDDLITLGEARSVVMRAVAKTEALRQAGTFVVADLSGEPVVARRMDGTGGAALDIVRGKTLACAVLGEPGSTFAGRMMKFPPQIFAAYQQLMRVQPFPGAGAVPLLRGQVAIGAVASGVGIGPFVKLPGVNPEEFLIDGQPANLEDLIISYAVGGGYRPEHGDDKVRWQEAYGAPPDASLKGDALREVPPATRQPVLDGAVQLANRVIELVSERGEPVAVVVADRYGHVITIDRMDGAPPAAVRLAEGVALTAAALQIRTEALTGSAPPIPAEVLRSIGKHMIPMAGGCPIFSNGQCLGAVGVAGRDAARAQRLADEVAAQQ